MIFHYDSPSALVASYIKNGCRGKPKVSGNNSWHGGESEDDSIRLGQTGDTHLVPRAEAFLSSLDTQIETPRKVWERSPAGAFCIVPDVIAGLPTPMRRQAFVEDDQAPISIFVTTASSASIDAKTLEKRGIVILALVMALARVRAVELNMLDIGNGIKDGETTVVVKINSSPLDLATACYVLTSAGFTRRLCYTLEAKLNGFSGGWPKGMNYANPGPYYAKLKQKLTPNPEKCLIIPAAQQGDELLKTPVAWIEKQIKHFVNKTEEEYAL